jgi:hypothetical protein
MKKIILLSLFGIGAAFAQTTDSTIVFESPNQNISQPAKTIMDDAWGIDILLSNNGFGLAGFYRHEFDRELSGTVTLGIAESKDDNEVEYVDWYGQTFSPGKINRFLVIPLMAGVQYRLFADDITDSFRPYLNAGAGPTMILVHPYRDMNTGDQVEYFKSLGYAHPEYTLGGYVGIGAFFGSDMGSLSGVNVRYYFVPVSGGIQSLINADGTIGRKKDFGGFFITINLGSAF